MAVGIVPKTTAQGEKMDETNRTPTAMAAIRGQRLAAGTGSRTSGVAATTVVSSISFSSTRSPVATGSVPSESHSGVRLSAMGLCAKLYGRRGDAADHSMVDAPHGLG